MKIPESYLFKTKEEGVNGEKYTFYTRNEWEEGYLKNKSVIYHDIDSIAKGGKHCIPYYEALAIFLNKMENKMREILKNVDGNKEYYYKCCDEKDFLGIAVCEEKTDDTEKDTLFYLKSDQFGFSAPKIDTPYDYYLIAANEESRKKVAGWIYDSRSLGGAFLWPIERKNDDEWNRWTQYNTTRGKTPMKDCVDLALMDIKNYYLMLGEKTDINSNLYADCQKHENMSTWMSRFGKGEEGFKNYCDFFCLTPFLKKVEDKKNGTYTYNVLNLEDLENGKVLEGSEFESIDNNKDFWAYRYKDRFLYDGNVENPWKEKTFKDFFNNNIKKIKERTNIMRASINMNVILYDYRKMILEKSNVGDEWKGWNVLQKTLEFELQKTHVEKNKDVKRGAFSSYCSNYEKEYATADIMNGWWYCFKILFGFDNRKGKEYLKRLEHLLGKVKNKKDIELVKIVKDNMNEIYNNRDDAEEIAKALLRLLKVVYTIGNITPAQNNPGGSGLDNWNHKLSKFKGLYHDNNGDKEKLYFYDYYNEENEVIPALTCEKVRKNPAGYMNEIVELILKRGYRIINKKTDEFSPAEIDFINEIKNSLI